MASTIRNGTRNLNCHVLTVASLAMFDFAATFLAAYLIKKYKYTNVNLYKLFLMLVVLGIFVHYFLNIPTKLNYYLDIGVDPRK